MESVVRFRSPGSAPFRSRSLRRWIRSISSIFDAKVQPLLGGSNVEHIGEITDEGKLAFLSGAIALLAPIDWPEPFGLAMIEAMTCGTPVIAFNRGSVPEVIEDGLTGSLVEDETSAIGAVCGLQRLSRSGIRSDSKSDLRLDHGRVVFGDMHAID
jgi:glycosyltransferase involved in cell wall biosynthesis